ncbi:MAG: hypothetical protein FWG16_07520, partial [Micrococcales bacterium]|nr:hypothetical protein [Micrococcales bacterium]
MRLEPEPRPPLYAVIPSAPWDSPLGSDQPTELIAPIQLAPIERRSLRERLDQDTEPPAVPPTAVVPPTATVQPAAASFPVAAAPSWQSIIRSTPASGRLDRSSQAPWVSQEVDGQAAPEPAAATAIPAPAQPSPPSEVPEAKPATVLSSTLKMASGTLVSRVLGLVRMALLIWVVGGLTAAGNAFDVANNLPNFIYAILAGGVLNAVLVPQIVRAFADGRGTEYVHRLLTLATTLLAVLTVVLTLGAGGLVWAFTFTRQWPADQMTLATTFAFWCVPQIFFYGLYTLWGQVLNARGSFAAFMWAPVVNNVVSIIGFGTFGLMIGKHHQTTGWSGGQIALLAGTATVGVALQALVLLVPMKRLGLFPKWRFSFRGYGLGRVGQMTGWTALALLVDQAAMWVAVLTATAAPGAAGNGAVAGNMA